MSKHLPYIAVAVVFLLPIGAWYYMETKHEHYNCYACWLTPVCVTLFYIALLAYDIYCKKLESKKHEFDETIKMRQSNSNSSTSQNTNGVKLPYADIERIVLELKQQNISASNLAAYVDVLQKLDLGKKE